MGGTTSQSACWALAPRAELAMTFVLSAFELLTEGPLFIHTPPTVCTMVSFVLTSNLILVVVFYIS